MGMVVKNPLLGKILINVIYLMLAAFAYISAFITIGMVAVSLTSDDFITELGILGALSINLVYLLFTAAFFYWKKVFAHWRIVLEEKESS